jgi:FKBP-type peptidyl-prolyl cis-trans isomerase (trigger factor)
LGLILEAVAETRNIEVTDEDFAAEMQRLARQIGVSLAEATRWAKQQGREEELRAQLRERKALEWVVEKAQSSVAA